MSNEGEQDAKERQLVELRRCLERAEAALRSEREKYRLLIERSNVPFFALGRDGTYLAMSARTATELQPGSAPDQLVGRQHSEFHSPQVAAAFAERVEAVCDSGVGQSFEEAVELPNGTRWVWRELQPFFDEFGVAVGVHAIAEDVTDKHHTQERLRALLHEKDLLLREVHHRVNNNLQIVSSLLNLQAAGGERVPSEQRSLRECAERVRVIGRVHERLYRSESLARVEFHALAKELVADVLSIADKSRSVTPQLDLPELYFTPQLAVPSGLILHELARSAVEHGFGGWPGTLAISMSRDADGVLSLTVHDPGRGGGGATDRLSERSLAGALVRALVRQLDARLRQESSSSGHSVVVSFSGHIAP